VVVPRVGVVNQVRTALTPASTALSR
jgi:hypothetical protein